MSEEQKKELDKQIELAIAGLDKQFGKGSVMRMDSEPLDWPALSTGSIGLDLVLGIGGWPKGRMIELYGNEATGKSTLCLSAIAEAQKHGGNCLFIDAEHSLDPKYAANLGVDVPSLLISQPDYGEQAIDILEALIKTGKISVAVVDSIAALVPKAELDGTMETQHMGRHGQLMSKAMRKLRGIISETGTVVLFTNQIRQKVGIVFGNPNITPGGKAMDFFASVRVELSKKEDLKDSDGAVQGVRVRAKVLKNKLASPHRMAEYDIMYGKGINKIGEIIDIAHERGILRKSGAWYYYGDQSIGNGRTKTIEHLASDLDLADEIFKEIQ